jgi:hypothetical protein
LIVECPSEAKIADISSIFFILCRAVHGIELPIFFSNAHDKPIKSIAMLSAPDGPHLLTASDDAKIKVRYLLF